MSIDYFPIIIIAIEHSSEDWTLAVDRGGLRHINDMTFMLFVSMEMELRCHLHAGNVSDNSGVKERALECVVTNAEVQLYWSTISANWEEEASDELLKSLVEHWVTIRGFSFTSAFMEKYKQTHMKTLQKSKGLRKTLVSKKGADGENSSSKD